MPTSVGKAVRFITLYGNEFFKKFVVEGKLYYPSIKNDSVYMPVEVSFK